MTRGQGEREKNEETSEKMRENRRKIEKNTYFGEKSREL